MSSFFDDTMQGLLEAVEITKGNIPVESKENMPGKTFVASNKESALIDEMVALRKDQNMSQGKLAKLTGTRQQSISRIENKEHSPSLKMFYTIIDALGYDIQLVKK